MTQIAKTTPDVLSAGSPSLDDQEDFLQRAVQETDEIAYDPRLVVGPYMAAFLNILKPIHAALSQINPALTSEAIMPSSYQSPAMRRIIEDIGPKRRYDLRLLIEERLDGIEALCQDKLYSDLGKQTIAPELLDAPPYARQGDGFTGEKIGAARLCVNACFRMIFAGIVGWSPNEMLLAEAMREKHGDSVVPDEAYFKIFKTNAFGEICPKSVRVIEMIGTDFDSIGRFASRLRERQPGVGIYAMASVGSATANRDIWHANVVLGATLTNVTCHDPSIVRGSARTSVPKEDFTRRWSIAYNRVQLVIAS